MNFLELEFNNPSTFDKNIGFLSFNLFKIKFYYEEDIFTSYEFSTYNSSIVEVAIECYEEMSSSIDEYLRYVSMIITKKSELPNLEEYIAHILEFFNNQADMLKDNEVSDMKRFIEWMKNKECLDESDL